MTQKYHSMEAWVYLVTLGLFKVTHDDIVHDYYDVSHAFFPVTSQNLCSSFLLSCDSWLNLPGPSDAFMSFYIEISTHIPRIRWVSDSTIITELVIGPQCNDATQRHCDSDQHARVTLCLPLVRVNDRDRDRVRGHGILILATYPKEKWRTTL